MKIEAVIVCVNYSDFLAWTLPTNKNLFNKLVVVTSKEDVKTQKLCEFWHVQCVITDRMYEDGAAFNKGKAINDGLKALDSDGWVVHMDADIFLPPMFRVILEGLKLDEAGVYAVDRLMCDDFKEWLGYWVEPIVSNEADIYVHPRPFPLGVRLAKQSYGGWLPLGYFQMWNQAKKKLAYPEEHTDAGRSDLLFSQLFDRDHRHLLGEVFCVHLETKMPADGKMGANWNGRRTPPFGWEVLGEGILDLPKVDEQEKQYAS
jgi:hypothetical protein